jgi:cell division control protein 24
MMAKGSLHQAGATIEEDVKNEENREVLKDLDNRIEDWKGHKLDQFGNLLLFDTLSITKGKVTHPVSSFVQTWETIDLDCDSTARIFSNKYSSSVKK